MHETQLTDQRYTPQLDAGPMYLKRPPSLHRSAEGIFLRAVGPMTGMVNDIVRRRPVSGDPQGEPVVCKSRRTEDSDFAGLTGPKQVHDHVGMLSATGCPPAFPHSWLATMWWTMCASLRRLTTARPESDSALRAHPHPHKHEHKHIPRLEKP